MMQANKCVSTLHDGLVHKPNVSQGGGGAAAHICMQTLTDTLFLPSPVKFVCASVFYTVLTR